MCNNQKSKFHKEQEARELLGNLMGVKIIIISDLPISNIFWNSIKWMHY